MHGAHDVPQGHRGGALCRRGDHGPVPAPAPAGRARLHPRGPHRRPARAHPAGRRPGRRPDALRARRHPPDVLAGARVQPAQAVRGGAHGGAHRRHPVQPDGLARLRASAGPSAGPPLESLFAGALIAISSTTIIAKAFDEQGIRGRLRELVVGVLIVEDLIAILLMAVLTALSTGSGLSAGDAGPDRRAGWRAFLVGLVVVGLLVVPRVDARGRPARAAGDDARRQRRHLLRDRAARAGVRLLGGARRVPRRLAGRGVRRGEGDRAPGPAGARRVRGHLLRLGGHADRPGAHRASTGRPSRC